MRNLKLGSWVWLIGCLFVLTSPDTWAFEVEVSNAPESDLALTVQALQSARKSILLNIYELTSAPIVDALKNRIQSGVQVSILEEGQPVGGLSASAKGIQADLVQAMQAFGASDHLYEMSSKAGGHRRFRFDHAKYAVIDGESLLIGSENYSPTGNPAAGGRGNRGWEVWIHEPSLARDYQSVFQGDSDASNGDIMDLTGMSGALGDLTLSPKAPTASGRSERPLGSSSTLLQATGAQRITSPDTSLNGLVSLIQSAQSSLDIEQMTFDSAWGKGGRSPLLDAVIEAARRGVAVRILLNDETVFNHPGRPAKPKNSTTASSLNQLAQSEGLNLAVRIADLKAMGVDYIHNKGMLVDQDRTLISSINWDENAVEKNREAAVVITSTDVHSYYEQLFASDWNVSGGRSAHQSIASSPTRAFSQDHGEVAPADCPAKLHLVVDVGKLNLEDAEDSDFRVISDKRIEDDFTRIASPHSCVLVDADSSRNTQARRILEIREKRDGSRTLNLEGYTPKTQKIYSIRTSLPDSGFEGSYDALVYDGSGPSREKLGTAVIEID